MQSSSNIPSLMGVGDIHTKNPRYWTH
jgi:hypothetical protein